MRVKVFFEKVYHKIKKPINYILSERKNKIEKKKSITLAPEKIEQFLIKNKKNIEKENLDLKKLIQDKYSGIREIGESQVYLWHCLRDSSNIINWSNYSIFVSKGYKNMNGFELDIRDINWVKSCKSFNGKGKDSLDDYIEKNNAFIYFLTKKNDKGYFEKNLPKNIRNKISNFSNTDGLKISKEFSEKELETIKDALKEYSEYPKEISDRSFSKNVKNMAINFVPYNGNIEWDNKGAVHTHHFLLVRWILKILNKQEVVENSENFRLEYLMNRYIEDFFDNSEIFVIPYTQREEYDKELLNNLKKISDIKVRKYDEIDVYKTNSFLFVCFKKDKKNHSKLINIFRENKFLNLEEYYDKYLKKQNEILKSYMQKNWITKEEIEKIEGLEMF